MIVIVTVVRVLTEAANTVRGGASATSTLRSILIVTLVMVLGLLVGGSAWIMIRHRKRGMMAGDENEDDVEYSRLVAKSSRNGD